MKYFNLILLTVFFCLSVLARPNVKHQAPAKHQEPAKHQAPMKYQIGQMPVLVMPLSDDFNLKEFNDKILAKSLSVGDSSQRMLTKIIDNSVAYWWNQSEFKNTSVGRVAVTIEKKLKAEMDLGTTGQSKTDHKLSFKLMAMQTLAKIEYSGWLKAAINYDASTASTEAEVIENLSNNKDLVISHSITANEKKSQLSLRWMW